AQSLALERRRNLPRRRHGAPVRSLEPKPAPLLALRQDVGRRAARPALAAVPAPLAGRARRPPRGAAGIGGKRRSGGAGGRDPPRLRPELVATSDACQRAGADPAGPVDLG